MFRLVEQGRSTSDRDVSCLATVWKVRRHGGDPRVVVRNVASIQLAADGSRALMAIASNRCRALPPFVREISETPCAAVAPSGVSAFRAGLTRNQDINL